MENTDVDLVKLHEKILELAEYFDSFCTKHNISYYLMGGTALGAMRHEGFIPWDDDFDVFMTYENYSKLIRICEKELDTHKYYLQKEDTLEWPMFFTKIRINGTTYIEEDTRDREMHKGVFIDIMCLNNTSENKFIRFFQFLSARLLTAQTIAKRGYVTDNRKKKVTMIISSFVVRGFFKELLLSVVRGCNKKKTALVGHFFGRAKFSKTSFPRKFLGTPRLVKFENLWLPVPEYVEDYLNLRYGEKWCEMPDQKVKNEYPSHVAFVDTEKSYKHYEK